MKTYSATPKDIDRRWYIVDADGMVLGRLASEVAKIIRGKHKPMYTPHMDTSDFVIVINASKVQVTGRKAEQRIGLVTGEGIQDAPVARDLGQRIAEVLAREQGATMGPSIIDASAVPESNQQHKP